MSIDWSHDFAEFLQPFQDYWHWHLLTCAIWFTIHFVAGQIYSSHGYVDRCAETNRLADARRKKPINKSNEQYYKEAKWQMSVKTTALVHSIVASLGSLYTIYASYPDFTITYDDLYAVHDVFRVICGISVGYFLYDFIIAVIDVDFAFLAHGSLSYLIFAHSLRPYCSRLGGFFLFYEVSTIFLNIRALMIATRKTDHAIFPWVEKLFFGLFLLCRIGIGLFYSSFYTIPYLLGMLFDIPKAPHSYIATALFILANTVLNLLNIMWTIQIINTVRRSAKRQAEIKAQAAAQAEQKKQD